LFIASIAYFGVYRKKIIKRGISDKRSFGESFGHKVSYVEEAYFSVNELLHCYLIGSIKYTRHIAATLNGVVGECEATESVGVGRIKGEFRVLPKTKPRQITFYTKWVV
jgi:hypothetical protein